MSSAQPTLAQRLTTPVSVELAGRPWALLFTNEALLRSQELTGVDMLQPLRMGAITARVLAAMLWCAMGSPDAPTLRELGPHIRPRSLPMLRDAVRDAWVAAMPEPKRRSQEGAPPEEGPLTWPRAWARARYELSLTDAEWLGMTPRLVHELYRVRGQRIRRENLLIGKLGAAIVNARVKKPITAEQFLGVSLDDDEEKRKITGEDLMAALAGFPKAKKQEKRKAI